MMDLEYMENAIFRLEFLRADSFDAAKTAQRVGKHFEVKVFLLRRDLY